MSYRGHLIGIGGLILAALALRLLLHTRTAFDIWIQDVYHPSE
jgi:hypothetical protein